MRPLLVTADPDLLDDLLRLCATGGSEPDVAVDAGAARRCWSSATLVLVGSDQLAPLARAGVLRRPGVLVVSRDLDDASVWQGAVDVGAERVLVLPDDEPRLVDALADAGARCDGLVVGVVGGRGGAGATTVAVGLALAAVRREQAALLVDGDPLGGGVDLVFGGERVTGLRWPDLVGTRGRLPAAALAGALPVLDGLSVLSWDRGAPEALPAEAARAVLEAARRSWDVVVVDLPRGFDDGTSAVLGLCDAVLVIVPAELRAVAAAGRVAARVAEHCRDVRLVVRSSGPLGPKEVGASLGLPVAGTLRNEPRLRASLEDGLAPGRRPRSPLAQLGARLLTELAA